MRRIVAALAVAGMVAASTMAPSASAQTVGVQGFGIPTTTALGTSLPIQCQLPGATTTSATLGSAFFGTCPFLGFGGLSGLGAGFGLGFPGFGLGAGLGLGFPGFGLGGAGFGGGLANLTLAQALAVGIGTTTTTGGVTSFTIAGQTRTLTAGQTLANTTVGTLFPNLGGGLGFGGVTGFGLNTGLGGLAGLGLGFPGFGLGGLTGLGLGFPGFGLGTANVTGGVTGTGTTTIGGRTCTVQGAFLVC
jgi:hypothetical protein